MKRMYWMMVSIMMCALLGGCVGEPPAPESGDESTEEAEQALQSCTTVYFQDAAKTIPVGSCTKDCGAPLECEGQVTGNRTTQCFTCPP